MTRLISLTLLLSMTACCSMNLEVGQRAPQAQVNQLSNAVEVQQKALNEVVTYLNKQEAAKTKPQKPTAK